MQDGIVIKSSKAGMTVILNPDLPFPDLLASIAKKFGDSARFWGNAQMTLTLEGRPLSAEEEFQIVNTITENSTAKRPGRPKCWIIFHLRNRWKRLWPHSARGL